MLRWCYRVDKAAPPSCADDIAQKAFKRAAEIISSELPPKDAHKILSSRSNSIQDFVLTLFQARSAYQSRKDSKAYIWPEKFSDRVVHYGAVLDVFVQHQPQYTALVWGAFKFLFTVSQNGLEIRVSRVLRTRCRPWSAMQGWQRTWPRRVRV